MNIEQLRQSLKAKWLGYYGENRQWLIRLGIWVDCDGQRRPSSSFILATLSILEPQLTQMFPLVVELNNNPDRIVAALGLNFNPDAELQTSKDRKSVAIADAAVKMLPACTPNPSLEIPSSKSKPVRSNALDETCRGIHSQRD